MVEPLATSVIVGGTILAIALALLGVNINIPYAEYGLPAIVLLASAGFYLFTTSGIEGILTEYSRSVIVGVVSSLLTATIFINQNN